MERLMIEILLIMVTGSLAFVIGAIMASNSQRDDKEEKLAIKENRSMYCLLNHRT